MSRSKRTPATRVIDLDAQRALEPPGTLHISLSGHVTSSELKRLGLDDVQVEFGDDGGRSRITTLTVKAQHGLTVSLLRQLPLAAIERKRDQEWASLQRFARERFATDSVQELIDLLATLPPGAHRRVPPRFYELVAHIYATLVNISVRSPSASIAEVTKTPLPTVQGWVRRARLRGLLPAARRGAAG